MLALGSREYLLAFTMKNVVFPPCLKAEPVAGIFVPLKVKSTIAFVVALGIRWLRPAWGNGNGGDDPMRKDDSVRGGVESFHHLLNGHQRFFGSQNGFFLHPDDAP